MAERASYSQVRRTPVTWLYTLGRSRAVDSWRKTRHTRENVVFNDYFSGGSAAFAMREAVADIWSYDRIRDNIALLSPMYKQILDLAFAEGYTHSEIAAATGLPLGTVQRWKRSALRQLKGHDATPDDRGYPVSSLRRLECEAGWQPGAAAVGRLTIADMRL